MAQGDGRRPSSAVSEGSGGGSKWEEIDALCACRSVFVPLTVSISQAVTFFGVTLIQHVYYTENHLNALN